MNTNNDLHISINNEKVELIAYSNNKEFSNNGVTYETYLLKNTKEKKYICLQFKIKNGNKKMILNVECFNEKEIIETLGQNKVSKKIYNLAGIKNTIFIE